MITNNDKNSYSKSYKKNKFKYWKILLLNICQKTTYWPIYTTGAAQTIFRPKIEF